MAIEDRNGHVSVLGLLEVVDIEYTEHQDDVHQHERRPDGRGQDQRMQAARRLHA